MSDVSTVSTTRRVRPPRVRASRSRWAIVLVVFGLVGGACSSDSGGGEAASTTESTDQGAKEPTGPGADFNQAQVEGTPAEGGSITFGVEANVATLDPAGALAQVTP